jgi:hypothetical protein
MIEQNVQQNQLPSEIKLAFKELKVLQHLKAASAVTHGVVSYPYSVPRPLERFGH